MPRLGPLLQLAPAPGPLPRLPLDERMDVTGKSLDPLLQLALSHGPLLRLLPDEAVQVAGGLEPLLQLALPCRPLLRLSLDEAAEVANGRRQGGDLQRSAGPCSGSGRRCGLCRAHGDGTGHEALASDASASPAPPHWQRLRRCWLQWRRRRRWPALAGSWRAARGLLGRRNKIPQRRGLPQAAALSSRAGSAGGVLSRERQQAINSGAPLRTGRR
mmetsp:Transcript_88673/g.246248  ORF Transcript_88673/g.246248 Transcript_88673/m.246248 type:complete len:216 (-) Transcript_88673:613-1260(-)